jgi:hypothetical protein
MLAMVMLLIVVPLLGGIIVDVGNRAMQNKMFLVLKPRSKLARRR